MRPSLSLALASAAMAATLLAAAPAIAQDTLAAREGKRLAETWCARCHVIGPEPQASALEAAPPFPSLAQRPGFDEIDLAVALYNPHPAMPTFDVGRRDIEALWAYIRSLGEPEPPSQETGLDPGRDIALELCAPCHAIEGSGPGPNADAPDFSSFARQWPVESLAEALAEGIVVSHEDVGMPEFALDPTDIEILLAYIESVQE